MKNKIIKTSAIILSVASLSVFISACAPGASGGPSGPKSQPGPSVGPAQGTVSGGGGNGCDGRAFETFSKNITTLEEYRIYIRPLLRRIVEQGSDPFVTYLQWVAEEKPWFFIPCELQKLSQEQVGLMVNSDQLARHVDGVSGGGVYVHSIEGPSAEGQPPLKTYAQKKLKQKAVLLLHEMVMGARLLMKKSAKEQCAALAKKDAALCSDPDVMAIAETRNQQEVGVMTSDDHEAVRSMTAFLADRDFDVGATNLKATRQRLGFHFPWDRASSEISMLGVLNAFQRSRVLEDRFKVIDGADAHYKGYAATCSIEFSLSNSSSDVGALTRVSFASNILKKGDPESKLQPVDEFEKTFKGLGVGQVCPSRRDTIHEAFSQTDFRSIPCTSDFDVITWQRDGVFFPLHSGLDNIRGVLVAGQVVDELNFVRDYDDDYGFVLGGRSYRAGIIKIRITREASPRIHSLRFEPKQRLKLAQGSSVKTELIDIPGTSAVECGRYAPDQEPAGLQRGNASR